MSGFQAQMQTILSALGIEQGRQSEILNQMSRFENNAIYELVNNKKIQSLLTADTEIKNLQNQIPQNSLPGWNQLVENLGKLQGYILLKRVKENVVATPADCSATVDAIVKGLNHKISIMNTILDDELKINNESASASASASRPSFKAVGKQVLNANRLRSPSPTSSSTSSSTSSRPKVNPQLLNSIRSSSPQNLRRIGSTTNAPTPISPGAVKPMSPNSAKQKYLKYKSKYLNLKNNM